MKNVRSITTMAAAAALVGSAIPAGAAGHAVLAPTSTAITSTNAAADDVTVQRDPKSQRGIIKLSACSASLVAFENTTLTGKAMMLTNGHCMYGGRFPKYGGVAVDASTTLRGSLLDTDSSEVMNITASKILYGTMTYTDAAIVELDQTYEDIKNRTGIDPLIITSEKPQAGDPLTVNSGYWKTTYTCPMVKEVHRVIEGEYLWKDVVKYRDNCGTKGGTSGSPVLNDRTGLVVAVNNTGNESGLKCTQNNPCEIDENGEVYAKRGTNYGTQTTWFTTCLNSEGRIDLDTAGCQLPKPGEQFEEVKVPGNDNNRPAPQPQPTNNPWPPRPQPTNNPWPPRPRPTNNPWPPRRPGTNPWPPRRPGTNPWPPRPFPGFPFAVTTPGGPVAF